MLVVARTAEILAIFTMVGLPVVFMLLPRAIHEQQRRCAVSVRFLLAPATGLALFAVLSSIYYATMRPASDSPGLVLAVALLLWLALAIRYRSSIAVAIRNRQAPRVSTRPRIEGYGLALSGLVGVLIAFLWPFLWDSELVFWHYAGSDGYMYMRIAEHIGNPGSGVRPPIGPYDGDSGFLAEELRYFQAGLFAFKPGTMSALAGLSSILGLTTHETFSPLNVASLATLYLALLAFGLSQLGLPIWVTVAFATLASLSPAVWMLGTHTFLGNVLALPLFPLTLMMVRPLATPPIGLYVAVILAAQLVVFPDGSAALLGMLAVAVPYLAYTAARERKLRVFLASTTVALSGATLLVLPFGRPLFQSAFLRLQSVLAPVAVPGSAREGAGVLQLGGIDVRLLPEVHFLWPAVNLSTVPPQPLELSELPFGLTLAVLLVLFFIVALYRRQAGLLASHLLGFLLLLLIGLAGLFESGYELFRGLSVFAFIPLAVLTVLPWLFPWRGILGWVNTGRLVTGLAVAVVFARFAATDYAHFKKGYDEHSSDAQYSASNLRDRSEIPHVASGRAIVSTSEIPTFTGLANMMMLLSPAHIGLPDTYHKFVFFDQKDRFQQAYSSDLVLKNRRYTDIQYASLNKPLYESEDFRLVENDLELFFDNDSFPIIHGFTTQFLEARKLTQSRKLSSHTDIFFFSRVDRVIILEMTLVTDTSPRMQVPVTVDQGAPMNVTPDQNGRLAVPPIPIQRGLHTLTLGPIERPIDVKEIRVEPQEAASLTR